MSDKIKKVTITIELDGTAEEEAHLRNNTTKAKNALTVAAEVGMFNRLPDLVMLPVGLFAIADIEVVRTEPTNQQTKAE